MSWCGFDALQCSRSGTYWLAQLAERPGAEIELPYLLEALATGCKLRDHNRLNLYDRCGAYFPRHGWAASAGCPEPAKPKLRAWK